MADWYGTEWSQKNVVCTQYVALNFDLEFLDIQVQLSK